MFVGVAGVPPLSLRHQVRLPLCQLHGFRPAYVHLPFRLRGRLRQLTQVLPKVLQLSFLTTTVVSLTASSTFLSCVPIRENCYHRTVPVNSPLFSVPLVYNSLVFEGLQSPAKSNIELTNHSMIPILLLIGSP